MKSFSLHEDESRKDVENEGLIFNKCDIILMGHVNPIVTPKVNNAEETVF